MKLPKLKPKGRFKMNNETGYLNQKVYKYNITNNITYGESK
jgi:hypothetical protein